jgi:hypothetical protein
VVPGQSDAGDLWDDGGRLGPAFRRHDAREGGGFRVHPRALQGRRPGAAGPARRPSM